MRGRECCVLWLRAVILDARMSMLEKKERSQANVLKATRK
jgi:hypothetical protein